MQLRRLGRTDLTVSSIGLGCVTFGREIDLATSLSVMDHAHARGITLFDTAEAYGAGRSESVVGEWIKSRGARDQIVLASKVGGPLNAQRIIESAEASLRRLQTDRLDLFQLHVWDAGTPLEETLDALSTLVASGKVRYVGASNWTAAQLSQALDDARERGTPRLASIQPPYNLVEREIEAELLPFCGKEGIGVITYSPLGAGFLTGKYGAGTQVPPGTRFDIIPDHQPIYFTPHGFRVLENLQRLAAEVDRPMAQVALSWVLRQPHVTSVLIGARNTAQVDQALTAEQAKLPDDLVQRLRHE